MVMPRSFSRSQLVDQGGLAVVDVGDDGDVAQLHGVSKAKLPGSKRTASMNAAATGEPGREICCSAI
jgi:hypothetical protein